ncbi:hypothetical protein AAC691_12655 [Nguyenibacter vanlangensis]|uniref:Uncharacterized protein n=1 Tax=Nguyenibacter vanlangensis TaxID=1216886 RepID=A0ABZ3D094_9PROT
MGVQFLGWFTKADSIERWLKICEIPFKLFGWFLLIVTVSEAAKALSNPTLWVISIILIVSWSGALTVILLSFEETLLKSIEKRWCESKKWKFYLTHFIVMTIGTYVLSQYEARTLVPPLVTAVRAMLHFAH